MATDEEVDRFVSENRDVIERMMSLQKDNIRRIAELNKEAAKGTIKVTAAAAELGKIRSEEYLKTTVAALTDPVVQKHFMMAGLEFLAGITTLIQLAPVPGFVKSATDDTERNAKHVACQNNKDCPAKVRIAEQSCTEC